MKSRLNAKFKKLIKNISKKNLFSIFFYIFNSIFCLSYRKAEKCEGGYQKICRRHSFFQIFKKSPKKIKNFDF